MFKRLYEAGKSAAENKLQKFIWSKTMNPDEKKEATGMLGMAVGSALENIALGGMFLLAIAAVGLGAAPAGLSVAAFLTLGTAGTALAAAGVFGKGMLDAGDKMCGGVIGQSRALRKELWKAAWNDLRGSKPQAPEFAPEAKPAADSFASAVAGMSSKGMAVIPASGQAAAPAPENK